MKRFLTNFCMLLLVGIYVLPAGVQAAYVDLRPNGIAMTSNGQSYDPGDNNLTLEVWIMPTAGDETLDGWAFDIVYDHSETLVYDRTQSTNILPTGWFTISYPQNVIKNMSPYVQNLEGFTFGETITFTPSGVHVADLYFTFNRGSLASDGVADFAVYYRPGQGLALNGSFDAFTPGSIGPDLAAVPLPATVYLLGSGIIGLLGLRRRKTL